MKNGFKILLLSAGVAMGASTAQAQSFEGAYVGAYAGAPLNAAGWYGGAQAGYNFSTGSGVIAGVEGDVFVISGVFFGTAVGRVGYEVSPDIMLYGSLGAGTNGTTAYYQIGAGGEFNVTDSVYMRGGVDRIQPFTGGKAIYLGKAGIGMRF